MKKNITLKQSTYSYDITLHQPEPADDKHTAIIYIHGGGLLYGERDDLPEFYIRKFTESGYTMLCMDYPLAPECPLLDINTYIQKQIAEITKAIFPLLGIAEYFLFGRSAGAYLCLVLSKFLQSSKDILHPKGIISFYGYYDLTDPFVYEKSSYYSQFPAVNIDQISTITGQSIITSGPMNLRYSLYVYARQSGNWNQLLGLTRDNAALLSLSDDDLLKLPPLFITASSTDPDVPFRISKRLSRLSPNSLFVPVYNKEHDFDRDFHDQIAQSIYDSYIKWVMQQ